MKIYHLFILLFLVGCTSSKHEFPESDPTISSVFDDSEIRDLSIILKFFDNQICTIERVDTSRINECYKSFFQRMLKAGDSENIEIEIPIIEQQKMYGSIGDSTFGQIWSFKKAGT